MAEDQICPLVQNQFEGDQNVDNEIRTKFLERDIIPYSITTISDSNNETLLVGTTSGQILEIFLP